MREDEGYWHVQLDADGNAVMVTGARVVTRRGAAWEVDGELKVRGPVEIREVYSTQGRRERWLAMRYFRAFRLDPTTRAVDEWDQGLRTGETHGVYGFAVGKDGLVAAAWGGLHRRGFDEPQWQRWVPASELGGAEPTHVTSGRSSREAWVLSTLNYALMTVQSDGTVRTLRRPPNVAGRGWGGEKFIGRFDSPADRRGHRFRGSTCRTRR
jgi:hypothetical protein